MRKDQFFNQHKNLQIRKEEIERKSRMYLREQEDMRLMEQMAIAQQSQGQATAGGGGGVRLSGRRHHAGL